MAKHARPFFAWLERQPATSKRLFAHDVQLASRDAKRSPTRHDMAAADWWAASDRTLPQREAFADLLLSLDADPFLGERQPQIDKGCRAIGFASGPERFGVIYQVIPAKNAIRIISVTSITQIA